jgi:hypothetical protein
MKLKFFIYCAAFITLAILANWFWFPEYLLAGVLSITIVFTLIGFGIGVKNMIKDADNTATKKPE